MTEDTETPEEETYRPTLGETSHTNPFTGEAFGRTQTYDRGKTVAADGGADPEREAEVETDEEDEVLRDVDHTPPEGAESANAVHARGGEAAGVPEETEE
jgi:hypothetical protein